MCANKCQYSDYEGDCSWDYRKGVYPCTENLEQDYDEKELEDLKILTKDESLWI